MLRCLLGEDRTHATAGNWNNRIGVPMTLLGLDSSPQDFAVIEAGINQPDEMRQLGQMIQADLIGSGKRIQRTPSATVIASPSTGGVENG